MALKMARVLKGTDTKSQIHKSTKTLKRNQSLFTIVSISLNKIIIILSPSVLVKFVVVIYGSY